MNSAVAVIPARYDSQRFPGKPLASILGKPMIQHVYERAVRSRLLSKVIIATDDRRIFDAARNFGAEVKMTSPRHSSGTERIAEIAANLDSPLIINIQGDEPLLTADMIDDLISAFHDESVSMATIAAKNTEFSRIDHPGIVKVVFDHAGNALYFSRRAIPYAAADYFWQHIGIYGYRRDLLLALPGLKESQLEKLEKLEQLKVLENGYKIRIVPISRPTWGVDYPEDIKTVESIMRKENND